MDAFSYNDIFATKGIEYIFIIAFLLLLIPFWMVLNKDSKVAVKLQQAVGVLTANILRLPMGMFLAKNHTWVYLEKSGDAKLGVDDFLVKLVGDFSIKTMKSPGEKLNKGDLVAEIDQNGKKLQVFSPISGEVVTSNPEIMENGKLVNEDPYNRGWIYSVKPSDWKNETHSFYLATEAAKWFKSELDRLKDFLAVSLARHASEPSMVALQEGGELRQHILSELEDEIWNDFQQSFLNE